MSIYLVHQGKLVGSHNRIPDLIKIPFLKPPNTVNIFTFNRPSADAPLKYVFISGNP